MIGLIGKKVGMTRIFGQNGDSIPATAILAEPCHVVQVKTDQRDGYRAVQLGAFPRRKKLVRRPQQGHFAKANMEPKAKLVEFRVENTDLFQPGQQLGVDIFQVGDRVKVTGTSKGKGFAGGVKRWGFHGGPKTHGQSDRHRAPGSLGGSSYPSRVWKGQKMAGRMGNARVSIRNLEVVRIDPENNIVFIKGALPGAKNGYVLIQRTIELVSLPPVDQSVRVKREKGISEQSAIEESSVTGTKTSGDGIPSASSESQSEKNIKQVSGAKARKDKKSPEQRKVSQEEQPASSHISGGPDVRPEDSIEEKKE